MSSLGPVLRPSRRAFLKSSSAALIGSAVAAADEGGAHAPIVQSQDVAGALGDREIRVALVGCGGRGTGAASQMLTMDTAQSAMASQNAAV